MPKPPSIDNSQDATLNRTVASPTISATQATRSQDTELNRSVVAAPLPRATTSTVQAADDAALAAVTTGDTERIIKKPDNTIIVQTSKDVYVNTYEQVTEQKFISLGSSTGSGFSGFSGFSGAGGISGFSGATGIGTPGGLAGQVQYNDGGVFGGSPYFTYDSVTNTVGLSNINSSTGISFSIGPELTNSWISVYGDLGVDIRDDYSSAVAYDSTGNIYSFGADGTTGNPFLVKYTSSGSIIWQINFTEVNNYYKTGDAVEVDSSGNVYVIVGTSDTVTDFTVIKLNSSGTILWQLTFDDIGYEGGIDLSIDSSGNVYAAAGISDTSIILISKINSSGVLQWQRTLTGNGNYCGGIAIDSSNNIYIDLSDNVTGEPNIVKYDSAGNLLWQKQFGDGVNNIYSGPVTVDGTNNIYTSTHSGDQNTVNLIKWDASGNLIWQRNILTVDPTSSNTFPAGLTTDAAGNIYLCIVSQCSANIKKIYIYKFDYTGTLMWQRLVSGARNVTAYYYWTSQNLSVYNDKFSVGGYTVPRGTYDPAEMIVVQLPTNGDGVGVWGDYEYSISSNTTSAGSLVTIPGTLIDAVGGVTTAAGIYATSPGTGSNNITQITGVNTWNFSGSTGTFGTDYYQLPLADGGAGTVLTTNGAGDVYWEKPISLNNCNSLFVNNYVSSSTGCNNLGIGNFALLCNTTGCYNIAFGEDALHFNTTGSYNIAIGGYGPLASNQGNGNIAIGRSALSYNQTGDYNVAIGSNALSQACGCNNIAIGVNSLSYSGSSCNNVAIGAGAGGNFGIGSNNVIIGSNPGTCGLSDTVLISTGNIFSGGGTERLKVDCTGLYINGVCWPNSVSPATPLTPGSVYAYTLNTGTYNTHLGYASGNTTATGNFNVSVGYLSLYNNCTGSCNVAIGAQSLRCNNSGCGNVALGLNSLFLNTNGCNNVAIGSGALFQNTSGNCNIAIGTSTLLFNTAGENNIGLGFWALSGNQTGICNIAVGNCSLFSNKGLSNVAIGHGSLYCNISGNFNTAIGTYAGSSLTNGCNNTFIGYSAEPASTTSSNTITLGNASITCIRSQVTSISTLSDARDKTAVETLPLGLDFINQLRPVKFTWNMRTGERQGMLDTGFIAQEVAEVEDNFAAQEYLDMVGRENPQRLEIKPAKLIPILVRAIQELSEQNTLLQTELQDHKLRIAKLETSAQ